MAFASDLTGVKPPAFNWDAEDLPHEFKQFRRYCELLLTTTAFAGKKDGEVVNYILLWMGPKAVEIFDNWTNMSTEDRAKKDKVWSAFADYFEPKSNFRLARFQLREMKQKYGEPINAFVTRLKSQANKCEFPDQAAVEDNLIDQVIKGVTHSYVRKQLLDHDPHTLTLDRAEQYARTYECTQTQLKQLGHSPVCSTIDAVGQKLRSRTPHRFNPKSGRCKFCAGEPHPRSACPASGQECNRCHKKGHWGQACLSNRQRSQSRESRHTKTSQQNQPSQQSHRKGNNRSQPQRRAVHHVQQEEDAPADDFEHLSFNAVNHSAVTERTEAYAKIQIKPYSNCERFTNLEGKADTGAQGNVLPLRTYRLIFPKAVDQDGLPTITKSSDTKLTAYNGTPIPQYGTITMPCSYSQCDYVDCIFHVADTPGPVIFGLPTCTQLGLVSLHCAVSSIPGPTFSEFPLQDLEDVKAKYPDRFKGLGCFEGTHRLTLKDNSQPVIHPPRRAPIQLQEKIRAELDRMMDLDVIRPVDEPTDWVSSITYVHKADGSLRICLDPKDLNNALKRGQHHIPTVDELTHKLANARVFRKLDAKSGYWSVQLDPDSQLLTTFNSPYGRFCFKRLPFGLKTSQDIFQQAMDRILNNLPGVMSIADDILVFGTDIAEHNRNLHGLLQRAQAKGLIFNPQKCQIAKDEIPFFGNIYSKTGVRPDPKKVSAITDIAAPTNVKELQTFLGLVVYLAPFIPKLSDINSSLRSLLHKDTPYQWQHEHQKAFQQLKTQVKNAQELKYFNSNKPAVLQVDASQEALGAVLTQDGQPILFASKSLTETEKRYANIERELLACVFGAERFHTYLYGKSFLIESDHRPLEMISKKNLTAAPPRLQRMLLRLQRYDYSITYRPGREMILADSLSRLPKTTQDKEINLEKHVCFVQFSEPKLNELREETKCDPSLQILMKHIMTGFPEKSRDLHGSIREFWSFRDELSVENGVILKGEQVLIPHTLRDEYLSKIHEGHLGITRCQQRARSAIYWPGINADITNMIEQCIKCQTHQASQPKEPMIPITPEVPNIPWHTIGTDLFTLDGRDFLILADYHSKYLFVEKLSSDTTSKAIAEKTDYIFSMFGIPNTIISDNGPQFIGKAYQSLIQQHNITHITSSPHHPKSHGFIERMIRTAKALIRKSPSDSNKALLVYRTTPLGPQMPSPAELMFGRKLQVNLPVYNRTHVSDKLTEMRVQREEKSEDRYNRTSHELPDLSINQPIFYQDVASKRWSPGYIIGYGPEARSYTIRCLTSGRNLRRNRVLIRPRSVTFAEESPGACSRPPDFVGSTPMPNVDHPHRPVAPNPAQSNDRPIPTTSVKPQSPTKSILRNTSVSPNPLPPRNPNNQPALISRVSGRIIKPPERYTN